MAGVVDTGTVGPSYGIAFIVSATMTADIIAKTCSSPQTAEINAKKRSATLMKWVNVGTVEAAALIAFAALVDRTYRRAIILGGLTEGLITYGQYIHAKRAGLNSNAPGTED